jgi:hypothetical protein
MRRGEMSIELIGLHWVVFRGIISTSSEGSGVVDNEKRYLETLYIFINHIPTSRDFVSSQTLSPIPLIGRESDSRSTPSLPFYFFRLRPCFATFEC